jgi:exonuclease SbcD
MRLLHFADLHLGVESYGSIDRETGLSSRLLDILKALDQVIDYAIGEKIDAVIFCGDAYQKRDPSQTHQREFARRLKRLSQAGIPAVLVVGNHDLPNAAGRATSVEIFPTLGVENIFSAVRPGIIPVGTRSGQLQVAALPWPRRGALLSREETRSFTPARLTEEIQTRLTDAISEMASQVDQVHPAVLAGHVFVSGAKIGSEASMVIGQDPVVSPGNIALPQFEYVALGHIHRQQEFGTTPPATYSGSLTRLDFSDEGQDKGFYVITLNPDRQQGSRLAGTPKFVPISTRRFLTLEADIPPDDNDPTATVVNVIEANRKEISDAIVKVEISIPEATAGSLQDSRIQQACQGAFHASISRRLKRAARSRISLSAEQLTPLEGLKLYIEQKKVPSSRQKTLLKYGEDLIREITQSPREAS